MNTPRLYMLLIGCLPANRHVEQHDVFFGIGNSIKEVLQQAMDFWPDAGTYFHLDAWRAITNVDGYPVAVVSKITESPGRHLYFLNLGGYKPQEFEEFHYKMLAVAEDKNEAMRSAKQTAFFRHTGFKGAPAHIDEKYGVDVDNVYSVKDILPAFYRSNFSLLVGAHDPSLAPDHIHLGYYRPSKVEEWGKDL